MGERDEQTVNVELDKDDLNRIDTALDSYIQRYMANKVHELVSQFQETHSKIDKARDKLKEQED